MRKNIVTLCGKETLNCLSYFENKKVKITYQDGGANKFINHIGIFVNYEISTLKLNFLKKESQPSYVCAIKYNNLSIPSTSKSIELQDFNEDTIITYSIKAKDNIQNILISYYDQIFIEELSDNPNDFGSPIWLLRNIKMDTYQAY